MEVTAALGLVVKLAGQIKDLADGIQGHQRKANRLKKRVNRIVKILLPERDETLRVPQIAEPLAELEEQFAAIHNFLERLSGRNALLKILLQKKEVDELFLDLNDDLTDCLDELQIAIALVNNSRHAALDKEEEKRESIAAIEADEKEYQFSLRKLLDNKTALRNELEPHNITEEEFLRIISNLAAKLKDGTAEEVQIRQTSIAILKRMSKITPPNANADDGHQLVPLAEEFAFSRRTSIATHRGQRPKLPHLDMSNTFIDPSAPLAAHPHTPLSITDNVHLNSGAGADATPVIHLHPNPPSYPAPTKAQYDEAMGYLKKGQSPEKAADLFHDLANRKPKSKSESSLIRKAQYEYGRLLEEGIGVERKNGYIAARYFNMAANASKPEEGDIRAQWRIAYLLSEGSDDHMVGKDKKNKNRADAYYHIVRDEVERRAKGGSGRHQRQFAFILRNGYGYDGKKQEESAKRYEALAARNGVDNDDRFEKFANVTAHLAGTTFGFLGALLKAGVKDVGPMVDWFGKEGYGADIGKLKKTNPELMDFETWLRTHSAFPKKA
ncbi:hypothetical protein HDV00_000477 [Rhizophlyctis rosea]|nr:hypothetical protein HDV00_000477 [Rhizophlyctis rosea]